MHVLVAAGADPSAFVGALLPAELTGGLPSTARRGNGRTFVVEADEYAGNFDAYRPAIAIVTSAEWDHPDVFADRDAVIAAFDAWIRRARTGDDAATLVANVDDPGVGRRSSSDSRTGAGGSLRTPWWMRPSRRLASFGRGIAEEYATAAGPATVLLGRVSRAGPDGTAIEIHGLDPLHGVVPVEPPDRGTPQRRECAGRRSRRAECSASIRPPSQVAWRRSLASAGGSSEKARPPG